MTDIDNILSQNAPAISEEDNRGSGILGGLIGGFIGLLIAAILWLIIVIVTDYESNLMAMGAGLIVGFATRLGGGPKVHVIKQIIAAILALVSILVARYLLIYWLIYDTFVFDSDFFTRLLDPYLFEVFKLYLQESLEVIDIVFFGLAMCFGAITAIPHAGRKLKPQNPAP